MACKATKQSRPEAVTGLVALVVDFAVADGVLARVVPAGHAAEGKDRDERRGR